MTISGVSGSHGFLIKKLSNIFQVRCLFPWPNEEGTSWWRHLKDNICQYNLIIYLMMSNVKDILVDGFRTTWGVIYTNIYVICSPNIFNSDFMTSNIQRGGHPGVHVCITWGNGILVYYFEPHIYRIYSVLWILSAS